MDPEQLENIRGAPVSRETYERLKTYHDLLVKWNKTINLVAPGTVKESWQRHIADSMQLERFWPPSAQRAMDFGSGGGFPGLVLAILRQDSCAFTLCESDQRKCQFLRTVSRETKCGARILNQRVEDVDVVMAPVDVITARAFAPLKTILHYAHPWIIENPALELLLLKGGRANEEIEAARATYDFEYERAVSVLHDEGCVLKIRNVRARIA